MGEGVNWSKTMGKESDPMLELAITTATAGGTGFTRMIAAELYEEVERDVLKIARASREMAVSWSLTGTKGMSQEVMELRTVEALRSGALAFLVCSLLAAVEVMEKVKMPGVYKPHPNARMGTFKDWEEAAHKKRRAILAEEFGPDEEIPGWDSSLDTY